MSPLFYYKRKKMGIAIYACITVVRHNISKSAPLIITISRALVVFPPSYTALKFLCVTGLFSPAAFATSSLARFSSSRRTISFWASSSPRWVYVFMVPPMSEWPIRYCSVFGFMPARAMLLQ